MISFYTIIIIKNITLYFCLGYITLFFIFCTNIIKTESDRLYPYVGLVKYMKRYVRGDSLYVFRYYNIITNKLLIDSDTVYAIAHTAFKSSDQDFKGYKWDILTEKGELLKDNKLYEYDIFFNVKDTIIQNKYLRLDLAGQDTIILSSNNNDYEYKLVTKKEYKSIDTIINGIKHNEVLVYNLCRNKYKDNNMIESYTAAKYIFSKQYGIIESWYHDEQDNNKLMLYEEFIHVEFINVDWN